MENDTVKDGYDRIAGTYDAQRDQFKSIPWLERFVEIVPAGGRILDVGCGAGQPVDAFLVERGYAVHGLDLSEAMIELARQHVPQATYEVRDMTTLREGDYRVDGIVAFYAIFHTPREQHQRLLETLASYLSPGAPMLITMGSGEWEGVEDFHGASMYWSHFGRERNAEMVENAGCHLLFDEIDGSGNERHQIILARKAD